MSKQPLSLREARTYAALAVAATLTTAAAVGAGASATAGAATGLAAGAVTALTATWGALAGLRLLVTSPPEDERR
jgi:hypothetical protein